MAKISPDELPNRAFQLAYFLHRERKTAVEIAARALNKLQLAATAQGKRLYYRLTGRADARKARSKVSVEEPHLLQRLVYVESEEFERRKEAVAQHSYHDDEVTPARQSDLVIFFIKHLVRITTRRNSFYVTLGLGRLLYNYTTPETMELYNLVIQDPDRVHDDYYYRSRKSVLLKELKERFGELIQVMKGPRGEQRWRTGESNSGQAELVRECLKWFTPWSTPCVVPERFNPLSDPIEKLTFEGRHPDDEHEVEVNRIHAALHPDCFARLAAANGLTAPDERLELPHFFLADANDDSDQNSRTPPNLSEEDLNTINSLLAQEAGRRKAASSGFLRVLVDGTEMAEINPGRSASAQFAVNADAEVVEVYGRDEKGPLLLATHLLNFHGPKSRNFAITAEGGQRLSFALQLVPGDNGSISGAQLAVTYGPGGTKGTAAKFNQISTLITNAVRDLISAGWWKPAAAFSVLALLFAGAWWVWTDRQKQDNVVSVAPTPAPSIRVAVTPEPSRSNEAQIASDYPEKKTTPGATAAAPTPLPARREPDETFVVRALLTGDDINAEPGEEGTRGPWNRNSTGKSLAEVHRVHVQMKSSTAPSADVLAELRKALAHGDLQLVDSAQADAALKVTVRAASTRPDDSRIIVIVRAVNENGYVVWPASRRSSSWRYVGRPRYVASRIVSDLSKDIRRGKGR